VPIDKFKESLDVSHKLYEIYPLWICPHAVYKTSPQGAIRAPKDGKDMEMYVDIGIWYTPKPWERGEFFDAHKATADFEKWLRDNRGYQATYAVSEQSREEFWKMFDGTLYRNVRKKYGAESVFMDTYDKVHGKVKKSK
jgi:delta24-sterol reductase